MTLSKLIAITIPSCLLVLSTACAEYESRSLSEDAALNGSYDEDETPDTGDLDTVANSIEADLWSLDADLAIVDGEIDPQNSTFSVTFWGEEVVVCSTFLTVDLDGDGAGDISAIAQTEPNDTTSELLGQWTLSFAQETQCPNDVPEGLLLGIGALDDQLIPSVVSAGLGPDTLNGLYIQQEASDTTMYVFGAVGTQDQFDGVSGPVTDAPIPDGNYIAQTLYLLPLLAD